MIIVSSTQQRHSKVNQTAGEDQVISQCTNQQFEPGNQTKQVIKEGRACTSFFARQCLHIYYSYQIENSCRMIETRYNTVRLHLDRCGFRMKGLYDKLIREYNLLSTTAIGGLSSSGGRLAREKRFTLSLRFQISPINSCCKSIIIRLPNS